MTALKLTKSSTALVRVLALPIMVGALAGCDFASRLPDAPNNLGGYDLTEKPPSVTGPQQVKRLPPPPGQDAFATLKAPVEDRTKPAAKPEGLKVPPSTLADAPKAMADAPKVMAAAPKIATPAKPMIEQPPLEQVAFAPLEFEAIEGPTTQVGSTEFVAPPLDVTAQSYTPPSYDVADAPIYQPYDAQPLETYAIAGSSNQMEAVQYQPAPIQSTTYDSVPVEAYAIAAAPVPVSIEQPVPVRGRSPVAILRSRLPNGAVVNVHPVIGAPGAASSMLARTVVMSIGAPINEAAAQGAQAVFDLRGKAERNTDGYVAVEWTLLDASKNVVGIFPERQNGEGWKQMSDIALRSMGQRVADRIARNGELRKATLYAAANPSNNTYATMAPIGTSTAPAGKTTFVLERGATLASAPTPRVSPRAATTFSAPTQVAARPAPVTMQPIADPAPRRVIAQAPRPIIAPAPQQPRPQVITQAPAPAPVRVTPPAPQVVTQAPARPSATAPTFPTLRRPVDAQPVAAAPVAAPTVIASGPRPLVFRGVRGAPGDGDQALGREVGKLLQQSGARMASTPQPGALFLTAEVSKTPGSNSDRIEIIWRVQDGSGTSIGQVTQANDVPRGALDQAWGQDAFYAAQGARDGIMELLQSSGALDS